MSLEEAYDEAGNTDALHSNASLFIAPQDVERYVRQITSITDERIELSDKHGIGYTILSKTGPNIQSMPDKAHAEAEASRCNEWIYSRIRDHRDRLGAFAALSMHDPKQAGRELERCVKEFGFHGALLYNTQRGEDEGSWLWYDQPSYDEFWKVCVELDVPVYLHPSLPLAGSDEGFARAYRDRKYLVGPPQSFQVGVSTHILGMIVNGVFDRFPSLQIIIGHLGERLPFDFDRTNRWIEEVERPIAEKAGDTICLQDNILHYFKHNIWITTSGHFHTPTLKYVCDYVGPQRLLFSVDYPYETIERGCGWWDKDAINIQKALGGEEEYYNVGRENAKRLFRLGSYFESDK